MPVYVGNSLLVMRSALLRDVVFVWTPLGEADPPPVDLSEEIRAANEQRGSAAMLRAALEGRPAGRNGPRPSSGQMINKYN